MSGKQCLPIMFAELASFNQTQLFWMLVGPWTGSKGSEAFGGKKRKGEKKNDLFNITQQLVVIGQTALLLSNFSGVLWPC